MYNQFLNPYGAAPGQSVYGLLQKQEVTRVNGKNGADAYQLAPDSSVLLLDTSAPLVWLVQTDGAGYKTSTPYSITPYQPQNAEATALQTLEARVANLEKEIKEYYDKSDSTDARKVTITKPSK